MIDIGERFLFNLWLANILSTKSLIKRLSCDLLLYFCRVLSTVRMSLLLLFAREKPMPSGSWNQDLWITGLVLFLPTFLLDCTGWGQTWDLFLFCFHSQKERLRSLGYCALTSASFYKIAHAWFFISPSIISSPFSVSSVDISRTGDGKQQFPPSFWTKIPFLQIKMDSVTFNSW